MSEEKKKTFAEYEKEIILNSLTENDFNIEATSRELKVTRYFLYTKISQYEIIKPVKDEEVYN